MFLVLSMFLCNSDSLAGNITYTYDNAGRLTAGGGNTYTWDTASRLTGINNTTITYNGLGNILTRTESGQTVRYHYNHAIGLSPIMAIKNEATNSYKYFVWTPSGRLLYMIDGADGNKVYHYHFDHTGSTPALTNSSGTVTDSYAYDPYGKVLNKSGNTTQPFTFVGAWGVRQERDVGTYHMRERYYDSNTARFMSKEPIWPQINSPIALNPYQYAMKNPMSYVDLTGLSVMLNSLHKFAPPQHQWIKETQQNRFGEERDGSIIGPSGDTIRKETLLKMVENYNKIMGYYVNRIDNSKYDKRYNLNEGLSNKYNVYNQGIINTTVVNNSLISKMRIYDIPYNEIMSLEHQYPR